VLGIVAEGCAEGLQRVAPDMVPRITAALRDSSQEVRGAAAFTLGQGLTLVHFSAQPEPFPTQNTP